MWYFELQLHYVESKYTSELSTFLLLFVHVKTAVYQGYGYVNLRGV